jgi:hypothetical protein
MGGCGKCCPCAFKGAHLVRSHGSDVIDAAQSITPLPVQLVLPWSTELPDGFLKLTFFQVPDGQEAPTLGSRLALVLPVNVPHCVQQQLELLHGVRLLNSARDSTTTTAVAG